MKVVAIGASLPILLLEPKCVLTLFVYWLLMVVLVIRMLFIFVSVVYVFLV